MSMDEDAMLVAIGQMDISEARDKWADEWADFCKKLTNWKSVYQLLRLRKLQSTKLKLGVKANLYKQEQLTYERLNKAYFLALRKAMKDSGLAPDESTYFNGFLSIIKRGEALLEDNPNNKELAYHVKALEKTKAKIAKRLDSMLKARNKAKTTKEAYLKAQDQYDITKPYAMGLLVADIFYSLSAAIEGDIY